MKCLETYRQKLQKELNDDFKIILERSDEVAVHDFRVGVKRLSAFYYFIESVNPEVQAKFILKPYRGLFKSIGRVRDLHITKNLILELNIPKKDLRGLITRERALYQNFKRKSEELNISRIKVPTVRSTGTTEEAILKGKSPYLKKLLSNIRVIDKRMTQKAWHNRRILLKRYHHTLDAFQFCPGHELAEEELKKIRMLEQLLGDWHDRVITVKLIDTLSMTHFEVINKVLRNQEKILLNATKIYHKEFRL